jgi:hypothetical protein
MLQYLLMVDMNLQLITLHSKWSSSGILHHSVSIKVWYGPIRRVTIKEIDTFQCCTETKLLTIYPIYLHGFAVHVFKFIWQSYKCSMFEPFVTQQISIRHSTSVQTALSISSSTLATAVVMSRALTWCWRHESMPGNKFSSSLYANCVSTKLTVLITLKVSVSFIVNLYFAHHNINSHTFPIPHTLL